MAYIIYFRWHSRFGGWEKCQTGPPTVKLRGGEAGWKKERNGRWDGVAKVLVNIGHVN